MKTEGTAVRNGVTYAFREDGLSDKVDGLKNASDGSGEGWIKENGKWYYLRDGQKVTNEWLSDGNDKYYVDENGAMCTSGHMIDGYYYLFGGTGVLIRGGGLRTSGGLPWGEREQADMQIAMAPVIQQSFTSWEEFQDSFGTGF